MTVPPENLAQLSDEEFWQYARDLAHRVNTAVSNEEYLECLLHQERHLIPLKSLYDIVLPPHHIALLPATPRWMPGIVAWRGEVIAVVDLVAYLSEQPIAFSYEGPLLIANSAGIPIGLLVSTIETRQRDLSGSEQQPSVGDGQERQPEDALVLDLPSILADVLRHIGTATAYG